MAVVSSPPPPTSSSSPALKTKDSTPLICVYKVVLLSLDPADSNWVMKSLAPPPPPPPPNPSAPAPYSPSITLFSAKGNPPSCGADFVATVLNDKVLQYFLC